MTNKKECPGTAATVQSTNDLVHNQDSTAGEKLQDQALYNSISDFEFLGVKFRWLRDVLALVVEGLEDENPNGGDKEAWRASVLAARLPMYISTLQLTFQNLSDCSEQLNAAVERSFEAYWRVKESFQSQSRNLGN